MSVSKDLQERPAERRARLLRQGLLSGLPGFSRLFSRWDGGGTRLLLIRKAGYWQGVANQHCPERGKLVLFGRGEDVAGCLEAIERAIYANRWREDRPWKGRE